MGQAVFAIAAPFGFDHTLTTGIVSGLNRTIQSPSQVAISGGIQTDAAIPEDSGGALLDASGRLVGIAPHLHQHLKARRPRFAIPVDLVRRIVPQLIRDGRVTLAGLVVVVADPNGREAARGAVGRSDSSVASGSAAEKAGLADLGLGGSSRERRRRRAELRADLGGRPRAAGRVAPGGGGDRFRGLEGRRRSRQRLEKDIGAERVVLAARAGGRDLVDERRGPVAVERESLKKNETRSMVARYVIYTRRRTKRRATSSAQFESSHHWSLCARARTAVSVDRECAREAESRPDRRARVRVDARTRLRHPPRPVSRSGALARWGGARRGGRRAGRRGFAGGGPL